MLALAKMMDTTQALHDNQAIAELLAQMAALLRAQESTPFRAGAYQHASEQVQRLDRSLRIDKARRGELPTIAPKRLNPSAEAWLPVLHTQLGRWSFTALYSNTARAHDLGKTRDWVVIYYGTDHQDEGQCTVVTQPRGLLAGRRIVRGREAECRGYYTDAPSADDRPAAQAKAGST